MNTKRIYLSSMYLSALMDVSQLLAEEIAGWAAVGCAFCASSTASTASTAACFS